MTNNITVSIVIVCMNNLQNLYPCLSSIRKYTKISYETLVVAYLFSEDNIEKLKQDYPWITIIESNEIRGFSENNNLALKKARGKYCFVLNDDTIFEGQLIDNLVESIETLPSNVAVISPTILKKNGDVQYCGRPKYNLFTYLLEHPRLLTRYEKKSQFTNKMGLFKSYNILGACFLIKTSIFRDFGWFDEQYFFCPEDIALSTKLNKSGYHCYVNSDLKITHLFGGSWSKIQSATMPASIKGEYIFYCGRNVLKRFVFVSAVTVVKLLNVFYHGLKLVLFKNNYRSQVLIKANINSLKYLYTNKTPKKIFTECYSKIRKE